uniref:F-box protein At3g58530 isoform X2 n=1 Tax=Rhizophora mucronata TaxID=61149 RepID=A0A2P2JEZ7_RHIMU
MPMQPLTSRVVIQLEQNLDRASRHLSVTPTIPNKLRNSRALQLLATAITPTSVTRTHQVRLRETRSLQAATQQRLSSDRFCAPHKSKNLKWTRLDIFL